MSSDLQWMVVRRNSCFLIKRSRLYLSREVGNLTNKHAQRASGIINRRTIGVEPCSDNKGVVYITKKKNNWRKPAKNEMRVELKRGSRRSLNTVRKLISKQGYRRTLKMPALRRVSAILSSQRPMVARKSRGKKQ